MSVYTYGITYPWIDNYEAEPGKFDAYFNAGGFYDTYGKVKPVMVAEGNAAYHLNSTRGTGVGQLRTASSWWKQWITNTTFLDAHPMLKMVNLFEFQKAEELTLRDFRISKDDTVRSAFLADFAPVKSRYILGASTGKPNFDGRSSSAITLFGMGLGVIVTMVSLLLI